MKNTTTDVDQCVFCGSTKDLFPPVKWGAHAGKRICFNCAFTIGDKKGEQDENIKSIWR